MQNVGFSKMFLCHFMTGYNHEFALKTGTLCSSCSVLNFLQSYFNRSRNFHNPQMPFRPIAPIKLNLSLPAPNSQPPTHLLAFYQNGNGFLFEFL